MPQLRPEETPSLELQEFADQDVPGMERHHDAKFETPATPGARRPLSPRAAGEALTDAQHVGQLFERYKKQVAIIEAR